MSVLFLSPSAGLGGAERVLLTMTAELRRHAPGLPLHAIVLGDGPLNARLEAQGVGMTALPLPAGLARLGDSRLVLGSGGAVALGARAAAALPGLCGWLRHFRAAVRRRQPAIVHSNGIKTHLLARLAGLGDTPVLWHVHDFYGARPVACRLLRRAAGRLRGAIAISAAVADDFRAAVAGRPVAVVPNAVDTAHFAPRAADADALDRLAGLPPPPPGTLRIGLVATYARWKGHDVFLRAAAELARDPSAPPVRFYVVGGPVYATDGSQFCRTELCALARGLGIEAAVGFVGMQDDPATIYPALDVVVHASTRPEPFGLTIVEAMACGRPVVAARAGGAAEIVTPGHDALGVPPGDVPALTGALRALRADAALRAALGRQARETATRRFDRARLGAQLWAVYREALGRGGADLHAAFTADTRTSHGQND